MKESQKKKNKSIMEISPLVDIYPMVDLEESNEIDEFLSCQNIPPKKFSKGREVEKGSSPNGKLSSLKENMGESKGKEKYP
jgi:hypothetical protein